ncbi:probable inactive histone-lysine N-methyltransferase SUVR2 [Triticum dicoccoides]|uniref:probable inactive histone-lysine N-methyltransferase SUVR2 n=1 Tax=Triticum dicoccoides TaxID=85692 RepID=UPI0018911270|nr:probable inactive histone-lysine N-methyltransferase SUVR2 [Triticum dicoccoides]
MSSSNVFDEKFEAAVAKLDVIGIARKTVSPVLTKLLELYDYNWEYIEADDFRVLTDAIFDEPDPKELQKKQANKRKNPDSDHYNKKLRAKHHSQKPTSKMHANEKRELAEAPPQQEAGKLSPQTVCATVNTLQLSSSRLPIKERNMETSVLEDTPTDEDSLALSVQGQDLPTFETPLAIMSPPVQDSRHQRVYKDAHERNISNTSGSQVITSSTDSSTNFEVALSNSGTGKLSFTCNSADHPDFHMPDMESVCKEMEARCLRTYKILEPNFSFIKLLQDTCQCIIDLGHASSGPRESGMVQIVPAIDFLSKPSVSRVLQPNEVGSSCMPPNDHIIHGGVCSSGSFAGEQISSSNMLVIANRPAHDVNDITKGEEHVSIPIINKVGNGILPPPFHYIPCNIIYQNAYVNLSLARIGDESCCSGCFGDCLAEQLPCACATVTGGEFAYTRDGLLKEGFLDSCVTGLPKFHCKICNPCEGHSTKKFIKECWSKCGCARNCGNRVVQRGITRQLQVFLTPGKKGWGLQAAEEIPRGAFICEYVGEILTNTELDERNTQGTSKGRHTYPTLLNADWDTEDVLGDDHALCLDATFYGNVARFINHRCSDANLIDIPVQIETPDRHYYHVAFFTKRKIEPFEELTWDYNIDFNDVNHPIKAFKCCCGSKHCRDKKSNPRSRSRALVLL